MNDDNGNRVQSTINGVTKTSTYDGQDRLLTSGDKTYTHTVNGEVASVSAPSGVLRSYSYNTLGILKTVQLRGGTSIEYILDGSGRRVGKKKNGSITQGFIYAYGNQIIAEVDSNSEVVAFFRYALKEHVPEQMSKGGIEYRIITDDLGSVRFVVDNGTGAIVQEMDYDEFGRVAKDTNPGFRPFGFAGGLYDRDTGLVRFGARDYDPEVGRWTSKDPILFRGGDTNLYGYTFQDPVNFIDPSGLKFEFRDAASQRVFNALLNSSSLSSSNRAMLDKLERSSSIISIDQGAVGTRPFGVSGLTEGFIGNRNSDITIWSAGTSDMDLSILLHELVHANQIDNGTDVLEGPAYQEGGDFLDRCKNGGK